MGEVIEMPRPTGIYVAMRAVMNDVQNVRKDRYNTFHKYSYSGHDDVTEALQAAFRAHGIVQTVDVVEHVRTETDYVTVRVEVTWLAADGSSVVVRSVGEAGPVKGYIPDLQAGKAISYAVKYAQLKNFMLVGGGIPDPESEHGPTATDRPGVTAAKPQLRKVPEVQEKQVELLVQEYDDVTSPEELAKLRQAVAKLLDGCDDDSYKRLQEADTRAGARVGG